MFQYDPFRKKFLAFIFVFVVVTWLYWSHDLIREGQPRPCDVKCGPLQGSAPSSLKRIVTSPRTAGVPTIKIDINNYLQPHNSRERTGKRELALSNGNATFLNSSTSTGRGELNIFNAEFNGKLAQNDSLFLNYALANHLFPPLPVPYQLINSTGDPNAQEKQHLIVLDLLRNKRNGIFVEAGAHDGEYLSTTLVLERDFGWTGLLVEPNANSFAQLRGKKRRSWTSNACLSVIHRPEIVNFLEHKKYAVLSTVAKTSYYRWKWRKESYKTVVVPCFPLFTLLSALNLTEIDYLSLDVEGAELGILKTIPWDQVLIRTLSVEFDHLKKMQGMHEDLKKFMRDKGYYLVTQLTGGFARDYIFALNSIQYGNNTLNNTSQASVMRTNNSSSVVTKIKGMV